MHTAAPPSQGEQAEALASRLFDAGVGVLEWLAIYLGLRLGLYDALAAGSTTPAELSRRARVHVRYAREWLEQQAVCGLVEVEDPTVHAEARVYRLPPATAAVLGKADDTLALGPLGLIMGGIAGVLPALVDACRTGDGIPYAAYGDDLRAGQAELNRHAFAHQLAKEWIPTLPDVHARLVADDPARVADIGCGAGWSCIALAQAFSRVRVDGFDLDEASIGDARRNAWEEDVANRVAFEVADAAELPPTADYDLVCAFDVIASLSRPVETLQAMRALCRPEGAALVMERRCGERFCPPNDSDADDLDERLLYALSVLHALPVGMADQPTAGTGAVLRPAMLASYAHQAGFTGIDTLPIAHAGYRFFRLTP